MAMWERRHVILARPAMPPIMAAFADTYDVSKGRSRWWGEWDTDRQLVMLRGSVMVRPSEPIEQTTERVVAQWLQIAPIFDLHGTYDKWVVWAWADTTELKENA